MLFRSEYLTRKHNHIAPSAPTVQHWQRWLKDGDVFLQLDGYDEVISHNFFLNKIKEELKKYSKCPIVITCRSVTFEGNGEIGQDFSVFRLRELVEFQRDAFIRNYPERRYNADKLIEEINKNSQLRHLAANPMMLSIICYAMNNNVSLITTRGELYNLAIDIILNLKRIEDKTGIKPEEKRMVLEQLALAMFIENEQPQLSISPEQMLDKMCKILNSTLYIKSTRSLKIAATDYIR